MSHYVFHIFIVYIFLSSSDSVSSLSVVIAHLSMSKLCSDEIDLDINSDNIVTQRKVVIYNGKPIVINIVVWE